MVILPLNFRVLLIVSAALVIWVLWLAYTDSQEKEYYHSTSGKILYKDSTYQDLPVRNRGKYRYIILDNYPAVFEVFIGKDAGDFKPKFEKVDDLKLGEVITVFHKNKLHESTKSSVLINSTIQFIDKGGSLYFEKGKANLIMVVVMLCLSVSVAILGLIFWRKGKIPF